jgi:hypothetical protein
MHPVDRLTWNINFIAKKQENVPQIMKNIREWNLQVDKLVDVPLTL